MEFIEACFLASVVIHCKSVTLGGCPEHFATDDGLKGMVYGLWFIVSYDSANKQKHHSLKAIACSKPTISEY